MLIRQWMTTNVLTVTPDTSMMKASKIMKENGIRRLPVLDAAGRVIGIVTDRDIKEASLQRQQPSTCMNFTTCLSR